MFLLNNKNNRRHAEIFPKIPGALFDLSPSQEESTKNIAWRQIQPGAIVTVICGDRLVSEFHLVEIKKETIRNTENAHLHYLTGKLVAKMLEPRDMTELLNALHVKHPDLPNNMFSNGFNVGNLGSAFDAVEVVTVEGEGTNIGTLGKRLKHVSPNL